MFDILQLINNFMNNLHTEEITLFSFDEDGIEHFIKDVKLIAPECAITRSHGYGCNSITVLHISIKEKQAIESHLTEHNIYHIIRW